MRRFAKSLKADMSSEGSNPSLSVPLLCNGSTGDFDSSSLGSNPSEGMRPHSIVVIPLTCNQETSVQF